MNSDIGTKMAQGAPAPAPENVYVFPVTFAQQRLWFLDELQPNSAAYNVSWPLQITGKLKIEALQQSLDEIVRRHEVLRTTFATQEGQPVQVVAQTGSVPVSIVDLSQHASRESEARRLIAEEAQRPLDLKAGPLVRAQLLRMQEEEHILLLTTHHIIFDGWSRRILVGELATLYEAFSCGKPSPLPDLSLQYADYAVWQRKHLQGQVLDKQLSYWKQRLAGAPASLALSTDHPRPAVQSFRGAIQTFVIPQRLIEQMNSLVRQQGATLFMGLLAAFQLLLSRYTGQDDIVVGTPIASRNRSEVEGLIGLFANTLVLRTKLSGRWTFSELLEQVKETALGAYAHQDMPFEKLVEELRPERSLSHNPLFQVLFSLQNAPRKDFELPGLQIKLMESSSNTAKFDLSLFLIETGEGLRGRMEYNTDLFEAGTIERMLGHYQALLEAAVASPEVPVSELPLLTGAERQQLLRDWNRTEFDYPRH
ncbi:MAG TPA: condensation domain-containing protein, partial [Terriglobales bacterium]|nr:condensation domain-containing protein [Terriglobales bacterium]